MQGVVRYVSGKPFGFVGIFDDDGWIIDYFYHVSAVIGEPPRWGDLVTFLLDDNPRRPGELIATEVRVVSRPATAGVGA